MSNNPEVRGTIKIELAGNDAVAAKFKALRAEQEKSLALLANARKRNQELADSAKAIPIGIQKANDAQERFLKNIQASRKAAAELEGEVLSVFAASKKASEQLNDTQSRQSSGGGGGGRSVSAVVQRAAGSIGLGGVAEISGIIDDFNDLKETLTTTGVSVKTLIASGGIAIAALGAMAIAFKLFNDSLDQGARQVQNAVNGLETYYQAIQDGTTDSIQKQIEAAKIQKEIADNQIAVIENARAKAVSEGDVVGKIAFAVGDALGKLPKTDELAQQSAEAQAQIDALTRALGDSTVAANDAAAAYEAESKAILSRVNEAATQQLRIDKEIFALTGQSSEQLTKKLEATKRDIQFQAAYIKTLESTGEASEELDRQINAAWLEMQVMTSVLKYLETGVIKTTKRMEEATEAADEFAKNSRKITEMEKVRNDQLASRARDDARNAQVAALESQIAAAREVEAQQTKSAKIVDLRQKAGDEEIAAVRKLGDEVGKVNRDYMQAELAALDEYRKTELRAGAAHNLQRTRQLEDLYDTLSETAAKGDVSSFIRASREGTKQLRRGDQDFGIESGQRAEDFAAEQRKRAMEREARLKELQDSFVAERAQRQTNLREQLAQQADAGKAQILQSQKLQEQLTALREQWAQEDMERQRAQEDAAFAEQKKAIDDRQKQLSAQILKFTDPVISTTKRLFTEAGNALSDAAAKIRSAASGGGTRRVTHSSQVINNEDGGIYTKPTLIKVAEKTNIADAVIGYRKSEGFQPAMRRMMRGMSMGGGDTYNVNVTTGSVATKQDIVDVKQTVVAGIQMAKSRGQAASVH